MENKINIKIIIEDPETEEVLAQRSSFTFKGAEEDLGKLERWWKSEENENNTETLQEKIRRIKEKNREPQEEFETQEAFDEEEQKPHFE